MTAVRSLGVDRLEKGLKTGVVAPIALTTHQDIEAMPVAGPLAAGCSIAP